MLKAFSHVVNATGHSIAGLKHLVATELAARLELVAGALALVWLLILGRSLAEILILVVLFCILMSVEALNSAVERLVDRLSPDRTEFGRHAKDLGSTAVFFMLAGLGLYVLAITVDAFGLIALR